VRSSSHLKLVGRSCLLKDGEWILVGYGMYQARTQVSFIIQRNVPLTWTEGWVYTDDSWQNPSVQPVVETDLPMGPQRKVTRRRRWNRPVYRDEPVVPAASVAL